MQTNLDVYSILYISVSSHVMGGATS